MKILIGQPIHEEGLNQLKHVVKNYDEADIILFPEGYISSEIVLTDACRLAKENQIMIITSYKKDQKDRAVIINRAGKLILERAKTPPDEETVLYEPLVTQYDGLTVGYLLCMEILKGRYPNPDY
jgi:predicted amidohydrolase